MKIGIITAMSSEHKQVAQLLEDKQEHTEGTYPKSDLKLIKQDEGQALGLLVLPS